MLNYINIIANNSVGVINRVANLLRKRNYNIEAFSASFDNEGFGHIIVGINLKTGVEIDQVIDQLNKLYDVKEVVNIGEHGNRIEFIFNINCNCKETIKQISRKPHKTIESQKFNSYIYIVNDEEKNDFIKELENYKFSYVSRVIGLS